MEGRGCADNKKHASFNQHKRSTEITCIAMTMTQELGVYEGKILLQTCLETEANKGACHTARRHRTPPPLPPHTLPPCHPPQDHFWSSGGYPHLSQNLLLQIALLHSAHDFLCLLYSPQQVCCHPQWVGLFAKSSQHGNSQSGVGHCSQIYRNCQPVLCVGCTYLKLAVEQQAMLTDKASMCKKISG